MMLGLERPTQGEIYILGNCVHADPLSAEEVQADHLGALPRRSGSAESVTSARIQRSVARDTLLR